jgi:hypothetical protein
MVRPPTLIGKKYSKLTVKVLYLENIFETDSEFSDPGSASTALHCKHCIFFSLPSLFPQQIEV